MERVKEKVYDLRGRCVVVTGSSRGIGRATAILFALHGADVVVNYAGSAEKAGEAVREVEKAGSRAIAVKADVTRAEEVRELFRRTYEEFGRIDVLVNNAGISVPRKLLELEEEVWDKVIAVNLKGQFLCAREAARYMLEQKQGKIVNIASVAGLYGGGLGVHYAASKAGVIGLTKALARELAPYVQVNSISPGPTRTELMKTLSEEDWRRVLSQIPLGRVAEPEDIATAVVHLVRCTEYINGQNIVVDGGRILAPTT